MMNSFELVENLVLISPKADEYQTDSGIIVASSGQKKKDIIFGVVVVFNCPENSMNLQKGREIYYLASRVVDWLIDGKVYHLINIEDVVASIV